MNVLKIIGTDVLAKCINLFPTISEKDNYPTATMLANAYGDLTMTIQAELSPIDLLYLLESDHEMYFYDNTSWTIKLHMLDVAYYCPTQMFEMLYQGYTEADILTDEVVLGLLGNKLSAEAQKRFANNRFVNRFIGEPVDYFNGWKMDIIRIAGTDNIISPITPTTNFEQDQQARFEKMLENKVAELFHNEINSIAIETTFSKRVTFEELADVASSVNVKVMNVSYGIKEMIDSGLLSKSMYSVEKHKTVMGNEQESIEFDLNAVNSILRENATVPVVIKATTNYIHNSEKSDEYYYIESVKVNSFDAFVDQIMFDNIDQEAKKYERVMEDETDGEESFAEDNDKNTDGEIDVDMVSDEHELSDNGIDKPEGESLIDNVFKELENALSEDTDTIQHQTDANGVVLDEYALEDVDVELEDTEQDTTGDTNDDIGEISLLDDTYQNTNEDSTEIVEDIADKSDNEESPDDFPKVDNNITMVDGELAFFVCNGTLDEISMIEKTERYQQDGVMGIIAMNPDENGVPETYYLGTPHHSDLDGGVRFTWEEIDHDKLFDIFETPVVYKVKDWYDKSHIMHKNMLWGDYRKEYVGGVINEISDIQ